MQQRLTALYLAFAVLLGCAEEPPPRSITEFVENPMLLEAAVVRCAENRAASRDDSECVNAREAVKRVQAKEEMARRAQLEAESERKRRALRQTQEAAARARRLAREAEQQRAADEYEAQFGDSPGKTEMPDPNAANRPTAVVPPAVDASGLPPATHDEEPTQGTAEPVTDLEAVREALRRDDES